MQCKFKNRSGDQCQREARKGWTMCNRHFTAGNKRMKTNAWAVNRELKKLGRKEKITQGRGYVYFRDGDSCGWYTSSVPVCYISDLSVKRWVAEFNLLLNDPRNH
jgi:hypothetical protein